MAMVSRVAAIVDYGDGRVVAMEGYSDGSVWRWWVVAMVMIGCGDDRLAALTVGCGDCRLVVAMIGWL